MDIIQIGNTNLHVKNLVDENLVICIENNEEGIGVIVQCEICAGRLYNYEILLNNTNTNTQVVEELLQEFAEMVVQ